MTPTTKTRDMERQIATTSEQSSRLLRCGVSDDTADMCWTRFESDGEKYEQLSVMDELAYEFASLSPIPAWSLSALLGLLPFKIHSGKYEYWLDIAPMDYGKQWSIGYYCTEKPRVIKGLTHTDSLIECAVQEIEWLTSNGYKLNEI